MYLLLSNKHNNYMKKIIITSLFALFVFIPITNTVYRCSGKYLIWVSPEFKNIITEKVCMPM